MEKNTIQFGAVDTELGLKRPCQDMITPQTVPNMPSYLQDMYKMMGSRGYMYTSQCLSKNMKCSLAQLGKAVC